MEDKFIVGYRKAISNILIKFKTIINIQDGMYKTEQTVLGLFKSGEFLKLPKVEYVLIAKTFFQPSCEACALDKDELMYYQISLVYNKNRRIITHETKNKQEGFGIADKLHETLHLPLKDATERGNAKWKKW